MTLFAIISVLEGWLSLCLSQEESQQLTKACTRSPNCFTSTLGVNESSSLLSRFNV